MDLHKFFWVCTPWSGTKNSRASMHEKSIFFKDLKFNQDNESLFCILFAVKYFYKRQQGSKFRENISP